MNNQKNQKNQIWALLQERGIVHGEQPVKLVSSSPWYIKVLLAFLGWLTSFFLVCFIALVFDVSFFKSLDFFAVIGLIIIAASVWILRTSTNEFVEHLGLAASIAGQILVAIALFDFSHFDQTLPWLLLSMLQIVLVILVPNFVHSVLSALAAAITFIMAIEGLSIWIYEISFGVLMFGAAWCWLNEFRYPRQTNRIRAVGYGLVIALIILAVTKIYWQFDQIEHVWLPLGLRQLIAGVVMLFIAQNLLQRYNQTIKSRLGLVIFIAILLTFVVSIKVEGITLGIMIICLGFWGSNRVLMGLGVVSLLFYISSYYYLLETTLLHKSISLFMVGLVLFFIRWLIRKNLPSRHEVSHV
jgi:uncharacterized membrane protein